MNLRRGVVARKTSEVEVNAEAVLEGSGKCEVCTGIRFLDHLIALLATHSLVDIKVTAKGDLLHHTVEDVAICLGQALSEALGDRRGIARFGWASIPMDESLAEASIDLARRPGYILNLKLSGREIEGMPGEDIRHFLESLAVSIGTTLHINVRYGENDHHKVEAAFKALALALRQAISLDPRRVGAPSSKGVI